MSYPVKSGPWWDDIRDLLDRVSFHDNALADLPGIERIEGYGRGRSDWQEYTTALVLERLVAEGEEILVTTNGGLVRRPRSIEVGRGVLVRDEHHVLFVVEVTELGDVRAHLEDPPGTIVRSAVLTAAAAAVAALLVVVGISVLGDDGVSSSTATQKAPGPSEVDVEVAGATELPDNADFAAETSTTTTTTTSASSTTTSTTAAPTTESPTTTTPVVPATTQVPPTTVAPAPTGADSSTLATTGVITNGQLVLAGSFPSQESIASISDVGTAVFGVTEVINQAVVDENVVATNGGQIVIEGAVMFESSSVLIAENYRPVLIQTGALMLARPAVTVMVSGHSDDKGAAELNQLLSAFRALAVKNFLIEQGIDGARIEAVGYGESIPLVPNDSVEGLAQNRRIELIVKNLLAQP